MLERQLVVAVEGTAALGPYWPTIFSDYLEKIVRYFCANEPPGQKLSVAPELALVVFNTHGPYSAALVRRSGWTKDVDMFLSWLSAMQFSGGGFSEAAISEGLAEVLMMFQGVPNIAKTHQNHDIQKHCILIAASGPHPLPMPVYIPLSQNNDQKENAEATKDSYLADAETVAKHFVQCSVSLSLLSPKQLPKLRSIYNAAKRASRAADSISDHAKHPHFLILLSENFTEARLALSHPMNGNLGNQVNVKVDGVSSVPVPTSHANSVSRQPLNVGNQPLNVGNLPTATIKVEQMTLPPVSSGAAQGLPTMQSSPPSTTSQEVTSLIDGLQDHKPSISPVQQSVRPIGTAPANANILNNLSQHRQMMNSTSLSGAASMGLQNIGASPIAQALHVSNMISSGMTSSAMPGMSPATVAGAPIAVGQNTPTSSFGQNNSTVSGNLNAGIQGQNNSTVSGNLNASIQGQNNSTVSGNLNAGIQHTLSNSQGNVGPNMMGGIGIGHQTLPGSGPGQAGSIPTAQLGQSGITVNQNNASGLGGSGISSGTGTMMPTPGMGQPAGLNPLGIINNSAINMQLAQNSTVDQAQPKYVKIWEGTLSGQRQRQPVFICRLEGYRNSTAPESLAADWPNTMQIVRLIAQEHMNNKQYVGKAEFLVFRAMNPHGFLAQLQEKKLYAVIQLPSQTLLLSVSEKAGRLIGMLFPGDTFPLQDMVVFKPQVPMLQQQLPPSQQQQQQQQQQQLQIPQQQQQLQIPQQQLPQPQLQQHQLPQHQQLQQQPQQQLQAPQTQSLSMSQQQVQQPQLQQPQMVVSSAMGQSFIQAHGRSQMMQQQGKMPPQGPGTMPGGGGFMP